MRVLQVFDDRQCEWDEFLLRESSFALLQSWDWGKFKEQEGWKVFRVAVEDQGRIICGAQLLIKPLAKSLVSVAYLPRGPFGCWTDEAVGRALMDELHRIARAHHAVFLKVEPPDFYNPHAAGLLKTMGFRRSVLANQPMATIVMDLNMDLEAISQQMRKRTREYIRASEKNGVTVRVGGEEDLPEFSRLMRETARREKFAPHTSAYYEDEWRIFNARQQTALLMAYYEGELLAVHMAYRFGEHAAYFHGGSSGKYTELRPNTLLYWEAIKWAKAQGCRTYDLWGIPEEVGNAIAEGKEPPVSDRSDALWGVYHFKRGFSKNILAFVGSWDYVYNPVFYPAFVNKYLNIERVGAVLGAIDSLWRTDNLKG